MNVYVTDSNINTKHTENYWKYSGSGHVEDAIGQETE
jgi:hypothetical protein